MANTPQHWVHVLASLTAKIRRNRIPTVRRALGVVVLILGVLVTPALHRAHAQPVSSAPLQTSPRPNQSVVAGARAMPDLSFLAHEGQACTHYVATTGNDANAGTQTAPWRTIGKALRTLRAGNVGCVAAGTYVENASAPANSGTASAPIVLKRQPGAPSTPIIKPNGAVAVFHMDKHYWIVDGFDIDVNFQRVTGFRWWNTARFGVLRNSKLHNSTAGTNVYVAGSDVLIENNHIYNNFQTDNTQDAHGIAIPDEARQTGGAQRILIRRNTIYDNGGDGFQCEGYGNGTDANTSRDITLEDNRFYTSPTHWGRVEQAIDIKSCRQITIRGSVSPDRNDPKAANNKIFGFRMKAGDASGKVGSAIVIHYNARHILIENTRIWDSCTGIKVGRGDDASTLTSDLVIRRTVMFNMFKNSAPVQQCRGQGIVLNRVDNVDIYHNTFDTLPGAAFTPAEYNLLAANTNIDFWNNIIRNAQPWLAVTTNSTQLAGLVSERNMFWNSATDTAQIRVDGQTKTLAQWRTYAGRAAITTADATSGNADPQFVDDPLNNDFFLKPTSSALNQALHNTGATYTGAGPDLGFRETYSSSNGLTCSTSTTLESLGSCIVDHVGPFVVPSSAEQADFRAAARAMLAGACDTIELAASLADLYQVRTFTDSDNGKSYCVLIEIGDVDNNGKVDKGWGTFIVNTAPVRELNIAISHPLSDAGTEDQGIGVFKGTDSRSFLLAGARRDLGGTSPCQSNLGYEASDAAHNIDHMFFATTQELDVWYGPTPWTQLQFHGMAGDSCSSHVHMTYGVTTPPASSATIRTLQSNLVKYHPSWVVTLPGNSPACSLNGTTNTAGRFLNGVPVMDCCTTDATSYSQKFIHIEQDREMRQASDWIQAVIDTWPAEVTPGKLSVGESLSLMPTTVQADQEVQARFTVENTGAQALTVPLLLVGARDPDNTNVDFPGVENITLQPGEHYTYQQARTFATPGTYTAWPAYYNGSAWIELDTRSNFSIAANGWHSKTSFAGGVHNLGSGNTGTVSVEFDLIPYANNFDGQVGYSDSSTRVSHYSSYAAILRMREEGWFDVRNGNAYERLVQVNYSANQTYHARLLINLTNKHYSVWVTPPNGTEIQIADTFAFRTDAPLTDDLGQVGLHSTFADDQFSVSNHRVTVLSDGDTGMDRFGVKMLYPTKPSGEEWYFSSPANDARFKPSDSNCLRFTKNADGVSWRATWTCSTESAVRLNVGTSTWTGRDHDIPTTNQAELANTGYMFDPSDWKNVEITGYVRLMDSDNADEFTWYARGVRHNDANACLGTALKLRLKSNGTVQPDKEMWHTGGYAFGRETVSDISNLSGRWVGFKAVIYNTTIDNQLATVQRLYLDNGDVTNNWTKWIDYTDKGGWYNKDGSSNPCEGTRDQVISWGGPVAAFRWDQWQDVDFKYLSVREIQPPVPGQVTMVEALTLPLTEPIQDATVEVGSVASVQAMEACPSLLTAASSAKVSIHMIGSSGREAGGMTRGRPATSQSCMPTPWSFWMGGATEAMGKQ